MSALARLVRLIDALNRTVGRIVAVMVLALMALIVAEVTLRYGFAAPTVWGTELSTFLFATYVLLGGGFALLNGDHVRMDVLYGRLPPRGRAALDVLTAPFALLYCYILLVEGGAMVVEAIATGRRHSTDWAPLLWPWLLALPVGAGLLALQAVAHIVRDAVRAATGRDLA